MKIAAFSVRPDEKQYFDTFANVYKVELQINRSGFTAGDIESVKGCEAMSVCDGMCDLSAPVLEKLAAEGVKYIGFRTIGYNSVDLEAAKRLGIRVAHSGYYIFWWWQSVSRDIPMQGDRRDSSKGTQRESCLFITVWTE